MFAYAGRVWYNDHKMWSLYLRIPVSAFTAQIRALKYTVGVWRINPGRAVLR